tara:strand:+ start:2556 stop:2792 length:237 start_codon:yes stop_codon:yes gene_type:complete
MKITEEELKTVQEQEGSKNKIGLEIGALELRKHKLLGLLDDLLEKQEITFEDIQENYGKININLETGEYEEIKEEETK